MQTEAFWCRGGIGDYALKSNSYEATKQQQVAKHVNFGPYVVQRPAMICTDHTATAIGLLGNGRWPIREQGSLQRQHAKTSNPQLLLQNAIWFEPFKGRICHVPAIEYCFFGLSSSEPKLATVNSSEKNVGRIAAPLGHFEQVPALFLRYVQIKSQNQNWGYWTSQLWYLCVVNKWQAPCFRPNRQKQFEATLTPRPHQSLCPILEEIAAASDGTGDWRKPGWPGWSSEGNVVVKREISQKIRWIVSRGEVILSSSLSKLLMVLVFFFIAHQFLKESNAASNCWGILLPPKTLHLADRKTSVLANSSFPKPAIA